MPVKEAIILAAGHGTRMLPISSYCPKEFLPLADIPLIHHLIWEITRAGIYSITLVISPEKIQFAQSLINGNTSDLVDSKKIHRLHLNPLPEQTKIKILIQKKANGVGDAIKIACENFKDPFLVVLGDNALIQNQINFDNPDINDASLASSLMVNQFNKTNTPCVGLFQVPDDEISKYGIVEIVDGNLVRILEKPVIGSTESNLALCGRYIFPGDAFDILCLLEKTSNPDTLSIDLLNYLCNNNYLLMTEFKDFSWFDFGNTKDWLNAQLAYISLNKIN